MGTEASCVGDGLHATGSGPAASAPVESNPLSENVTPWPVS